MERRRKRKELKPAALPSSFPSSSSSRKKKRKVKWAQHYSSSHYLLLVGEGDFSFALSLATTFASAANIVATSHDSHEAVQAKYGKAKENLQLLQNLGAKVLHEIDAATMDLHNELKMHRFDRIIFNFPHAGFIGKEDQMKVINLHRQLVFGFFGAAAKMLRPDGEIHVAHKIGNPYDQWNLEELAAKCSLQLIECSKFQQRDYPGYINKRGAGSSPDSPFSLGACRTFKFKAYDLRLKLNTSMSTRRMQPSAGMEFNRETYDLSLRLNPSMLARRMQPLAVGMEFNGEEILGRDQSFPRIEQNYIRSEGNNLCLAGMRDCFCKKNHVSARALNDLQRLNLMEWELAYRSVLSIISSMRGRNGRCV